MTHLPQLLISIEWRYLHIIHFDAPRRKTDFNLSFFRTTTHKAHFKLKKTISQPKINNDNNYFISVSMLLCDNWQGTFNNLTNVPSL